MPWVKNDHIASSVNRFSCHQWVYRCRRLWCNRENSRKVILERMCALVERLLLSTSPRVTRAKITSWVIFRQCDCLRWLYLAKPGPLSAMGRNEYMLIEQRVDCQIEYKSFNPKP